MWAATQRDEATWSTEQGLEDCPIHGGHPCSGLHPPTSAVHAQGLGSSLHLHPQAARPHLNVPNLSSWQNPVQGLGSRSCAH